MRRLLRFGTALLCGAAVFHPAAAADFFLYLRCEGKVDYGRSSTAGHVDLALRDNNMTALIQRSNVLPVGQRLKYEVSPISYSMNYQIRAAGSTVLYDWWRGPLFVWQPNLKQVTTVRLSIDRQTGALSGEMLNAEAEMLATLRMDCQAISEESLPAPKF
jgi:hypothetical protein